MRIGINGGGDQPDLKSALDQARGAAEAGFPSYWLSQIFGLDALTALAVIGCQVPGIELGVAVVPTYPRHPQALASQAQTVQQALGGRLVLGIGPSHQLAVEAMWGGDYSRPYSHTRDYLAALRPLLDGEAVNQAGEQIVARGQLSLAAPHTPILVAGLGPRMLALAGASADGTATWMCGVKTLREHIVPRVRAAAQDAGREAPRIVAGLPICVTDDVSRARAFAEEKLSRYAALPSYRAMLDLEGAEGPANICLIGNEATVTAGLDDLAQAGVTDLRAAELAPSPEDAARTRALLRSRL